MVRFFQNQSFFLDMPTRASRRLGSSRQNAEQKHIVAIERKQKKQDKSREQTQMTKKTFNVPEAAFDTLPMYNGMEVYSNAAFEDINKIIPSILCLEDRTEYTLSG